MGCCDLGALPANPSAAFLRRRARLNSRDERAPIPSLLAASGLHHHLIRKGLRPAAGIIVETGDIRRFTEAGFARFNGTAPIPASSGEGENAPVRHRLSRGGNRRLNAAIYRIAMIQLRYEPRARRIHDQARAHGQRQKRLVRARVS